MLEKGDLLTLSDKQEYIVMNQIMLKGKNYVYLISKDGISRVIICSYENDELKVITDENMIKELIDKFTEIQGD